MPHGKQPTGYPIRQRVHVGRSSIHGARDKCTATCIFDSKNGLGLAAFLHDLLPRLESLELDGEPELTATLFAGGLKRLPIHYKLTM